MKKKAKRGLENLPGMRRMRCPYCGSPVILRDADGIYQKNSENAKLYVCARYPACDAYVRVHTGTKTPVGTLANHELRTLRRQAHQYFDKLYTTGLMSKHEAYLWLAGILAAPLSQAHIGYLGEYYCGLVIKESKKLLAHRKTGRKLMMASGGGVYAANR